MTIILFLVDTSASMNQRTYLGNTLLDAAKASVETFMKLRGRDPQSRWDRYMLLTFEDPPANIKAGWKENHATFTTELKNLQCTGLTMMGTSLKHAFDLLNVNRMQSGIDTYGQGRCPYFLEPAVIIILTDGGKLTTQSGIHSELNLPMTSTVPGSELTKEPFRWDQRIFGLVMNLPASYPIDNQGPPYIPSAENCPLDAMCEVTGGRSYMVTSQRMLNAALESLVQKVQSGVVINFEKFGPDPLPVNNEVKPDFNGDMNGFSKENRDINRQDLPPLLLRNGMEEKKRSITPVPVLSGWHNCRRLIYVQRSAQKGYSVGHWPIPEAFWPDLNSPSLPPRSAQPVVKFSCTSCDPMVIENLPFDKYEMEPSPLTQYILERRQPSTCWQVFVSNSAKYSDIGHPFGYLKASSNLLCVNLFVMPYNYPALLPLLDELFKVHKLKPPPKWRQQFDNYVKTMPIYYATPLRRALQMMGAPNLVPDNMDNCLSYSVISYLKKLKNQAKIEMDRLVASVGQKIPLYEGIRVVSRSKTSVLQRKDFNQLLHNAGGNLANLKQELTDYNSFVLGVEEKSVYPQYYRNPYDIPRDSLLDQIARMRANFLQATTTNTKLVDEDQVHSIPVQQMGNYQEYLKRMPQPLRELETAPVRQHMFGNPFKVNKNIMIDEADEAMMGQQIRHKKTTEKIPQSPGPRKRKPGPLPKDFPVWRPSSPSIESSSPVQSPCPSPAPSPVFEELESGEAAPSVKTNSTRNEDEDPGTLVIDIENDVTETEGLSNTAANHVILNNQPISEPPLKVAKTEIEELTNHKQDAVIWSHNTRLRHILYKEIKRPGRNYDNLFNHLNTMQGNLDTKRTFIRDIMREANRFKKRALVQMLEQFEQSMVRLETKRLSGGGVNNVSPLPMMQTSR